LDVFADEGLRSLTVMASDALERLRLQAVGSALQG
jgi:hypothetical protein